MDNNGMFNNGIDNNNMDNNGIDNNGMDNNNMDNDGMDNNGMDNNNMDIDRKEQLEVVAQKLQELSSTYREAVGYIGISENEFWIWYTLVLSDGEYSQRDICDLWSLSKQTVNTIVSHMVQKGYADLEVVPGTRNRKIIRLTDAGKQYGERIVIPVSNAGQRAIDRLSPEEFTAGSAALTKFITILKEEMTDAKFN